MNISNEKEEREKASVPEIIEEKRYGTSDFLRIPKTWRIIPGLEKHLVFEAVVEKDAHGIPYLVFRKVTEPCQRT